ncbi:MAG TPA: triose-phosphate isomerase [Candidatus Paceibacterota bacterium]|nr:triose-phosphate isomerase [Candidatus Paceibacterota bacterium]
MLIVANWKAYVDDSAKAKKLFAVSKRLARTTDNAIVLAPPSPLLGALTSGNKSKVAFAAQDVSLSTGGAKTGEATAGAYAAAGATYAIIGHSERRAAGDTDDIVAEKLARAFAHELTPILCMGERERDGEGRYLAFIRKELTAALAALTLKERAQVIVAYEPLWAIGKTAAFAIGPNDLSEMALYIRKVLAELLPGRHHAHALVLYGGSVEPDNIRALAAGSGIDGFLIGHASVNPKIFSELVKQLHVHV